MKTIFFLLLVVVPMLFPGCASRKDMTRSRQEIQSLQQQVVQLQAEQGRLNQTLSELKKIIEKNNDTVYKYQAETRQQLRELSNQTQILDDRLDETLGRISGLSDKVSLSTPAAAGSDSAQTSAAETFSEAEGIYQSAYQDLVQGKYELARQGFNRFLEQFPNSEMSDNAQYWIGETYYAQNQYAEAARIFQSVISQYPNGDKVSAALLKLAYSQIALNQRPAARRSLEKLIREFPNSNEANLARSRLKEL